MDPHLTQQAIENDYDLVDLDSNIVLPEVWSAFLAAYRGQLLTITM
jgi:hypothetical protein